MVKFTKVRLLRRKKTRIVKRVKLEKKSADQSSQEYLLKCASHYMTGTPIMNSK